MWSSVSQQARASVRQSSSSSSRQRAQGSTRTYLVMWFAEPKVAVAARGGRVLEVPSTWHTFRVKRAGPFHAAGSARRALKELHASWDNEMRCQGCRFPPRAMLRRRGRVPVRRNSRHLYFSCTLLFFVPNVTLRVVVWLGWYATAADVQLLRAIDPADGLEGLHERPRKGHGVRFCVNSTSFARRL